MGTLESRSGQGPRLRIALLEKPELRELSEVRKLRQLQLSAVEACASYLRAVEAVACRVRSDLQRGAWRGMTFGGGGPPASGFEAPTARVVTVIGRSLSIVKKYGDGYRYSTVQGVHIPHSTAQCCLSSFQ